MVHESRFKSVDVIVQGQVQVQVDVIIQVQVQVELELELGCPKSHSFIHSFLKMTGLF